MTLAIEKYWITRKNIYNFGKKKFIIRAGITAYQIITLKKMRSRELIKANQDRNEE